MSTLQSSVNGRLISPGEHVHGGCGQELESRARVWALRREPEAPRGRPREWPLRSGGQRALQLDPSQARELSVPTGPPGPAPRHDLCLRWTLASLPSSASRLAQQRGQVTPSGPCLPSHLLEGAHPKCSSSPQSPPLTQPTSIWRDISPSPAPVTSTVVAQPTGREGSV